MGIHRSNRLEDLADALARTVEAPLSSPFAKEVILVPSRALGTWLETELARRHGVWANPELRTPRVWFDGLATIGDEGDEEDPFDPDALAWSIAALLPTLVADAAFEEVRRYLEGDADGTKRLALAARVARLFDRYLLHRPDLVRAWERGEADHWQARLFRALVARHGGGHIAARIARLVDDLRAGRPTDLPARISIFCVGPLAPLLGEALDALAKKITVEIFELAADGPIAPAGTLLGELQRAPVDPPPRAELRPDDRSVSLHACHSPTRECEVLKDQMLAALQQDPSLEPRDMLVLCPDLETYGPAIDAVFGGDPRGDRHLPHRIADRPAGAQLPVCEALLSLLDAATSRMTAPAVLDLLFRAPIHERFDLGELDVETIRGWIEESGIRWAADANHREEEGQPKDGQNTWRFGVDRLLLGFAAGEAGDRTYADVLPFDDVEGSRGATLAALAAFSDGLAGLRRELAGRATIAVWRERILAALERFVAVTRTTGYQHQIVRTALDAIAARTEAADFDEEVPLAVVRDALGAAIAADGGGFDLADGPVTFASLRPGRTVPARFVALLGMNDGAFPRAPSALGFDLLAKEPRPGDPSARDEDRRVFREALLAARDRLVVTFIGRSIKNDAERTPSVLVSEMLDHIDAVFSRKGEPLPRDAVTVRHALHAFSARYFKGEDERVFSHDPSLCEAALAMMAPRIVAPGFVEKALPPPPGEEAARPVTVDELSTFFKHPVEAFVKSGVGVYLSADVVPLKDREPLELDALEAWAIGTEIVERVRHGEDVTLAPVSIRASGQLPLGTPGIVWYDEERPLPTEMGRRVAELLGPTAPAPLEIDLTLEGGARVIGWLRSVGPRGQVLYRYSKTKGKNDLDAWIRHLCMLAAGGRGPTYLFSKGDDGLVERTFVEVAKPLVILADLVSLLRLGRRVPLPLFPDAANAYVAKLRNGGTEAQALGAARSAYRKDFGDAENAYVKKVYGEADPLDPAFCLLAEDQSGEEPPRFAEVARRVFDPLLDHLKETP